MYCSPCCFTYFTAGRHWQSKSWWWRIQTLKTAYKDADPRIQTINSVIIDGNGQTPKSPAFNEAFNAAGSPWQLLVQNAVWGSGDLKADNKAVTDVLSAQ